MSVNCDKSFKDNCQGFTLLEFAMSIVISGIIIASLLAAYKLSMKSAERESHIQIMNVAAESLDMYFVLRNRLPCPANPNLPVTDVNYGRANCTLPLTIARGRNVMPSDPPIDLNGDGDQDQIMIGMMPTFVCINPAISQADACPNTQNDRIALNTLSDTFRRQPIDLGKTRLTYVVSEIMSDASNNPVADFRMGSITVLDEFDNYTGGNRDNAHYLLIDSGSNTCASIAQARTTFAQAYETENENCDGDSIFTAGLLNLNENNAFFDFFDDQLFFRSGMMNIMWQPISIAGAASSNVKTLASGNFGIRTRTPAFRLDVNGNALANNYIRSSFICDDTTSVCVQAQAMSNVSCIGNGNGFYIKTIRRNGTTLEAVCEPITFARPTGAEICPPGTFLQGVYSDGALQCN